MELMMIRCSISTAKIDLDRLYSINKIFHADWILELEFPLSIPWSLVSDIVEVIVSISMKEGIEEVDRDDDGADGAVDIAVVENGNDDNDDVGEDNNAVNVKSFSHKK